MHGGRSLIFSHGTMGSSGIQMQHSLRTYRLRVEENQFHCRRDSQRRCARPAWLGGGMHVAWNGFEAGALGTAVGRDARTYIESV